MPHNVTKGLGGFVSKRLFVALLLGAAMCAVAGMAASLDVSSAGSLGAGSASIPSCDDTVDISYKLDETKVTHVIVAGIADPACVGANLSLTLVDTDGNALVSTSPVRVQLGAGNGSTAVTVELSSPVDVAAVSNVHVMLEGP